jgi:hypothetical protein
LRTGRADAVVIALPRVVPRRRADADAEIVFFATGAAGLASNST